MRSLPVVIFLLIAIPALAQSGAGSQDSSVIGHLRPRWGSYIVGCFPSPAKAGEKITVQTYNHNPVELSVTVYDMSGRELIAFASKQMMPGGLQTFVITPFRLATGTYRVRLVTYTASGASDIVDDAKFLIVH